MNIRITKREFTTTIISIINDGLSNPKEYEEHDMDEWSYFLHELRQRGLSSSIRKVNENTSARSSSVSKEIQRMLTSGDDKTITIIG